MCVCVRLVLATYEATFIALSSISFLFILQLRVHCKCDSGGVVDKIRQENSGRISFCFLFFPLVFDKISVGGFLT